MSNPKLQTRQVARAAPAKFERWITAALTVLAIVAGGFTLRPQGVTRGAVTLENPAIRVSVTGEVQRPGVYELPFGARVQAAIEAAGGLTHNAEPSLIRPAEQLEDGEPVLIPSRLVSSPALTAKPGTGAPTERINLNNATPEQLQSLPGVGPKLAARLIAGRPYSSLTDLDAVKGIGPNMLEKLGPLVRF
jgi:competence protein ComEA